MIVPMIVFGVRMVLGRDELGWKGILFCVALWCSLLLGLGFFNVSPYIFVGIQAFLDVILILVIFKGDITIR